MDGVNGAEVTLKSEAAGAFKALHLMLHAARYTFHKLVRAKYAEQLQNGFIPVEQAREMYRLAMANYDGIIGTADSGASHKANNDDMHRGFDG